jgi:TRAP-type mannitol/chloroaromatic compound transport system permease large subunit
MEKGSVSQTFHNLINDLGLWVSIQIRVAIVLGIIFLKIATPGLGGSLLTIGAAIMVGLVSALPMLRRARVHETSLD